MAVWTVPQTRWTTSPRQARESLGDVNGSVRLLRVALERLTGLPARARDTAAFSKAQPLRV
jgi:hypothetical protein